MNAIEIVNKEKKYEGKVFDIYEYKINIQNDTIKRDISTNEHPSTTNRKIYIFLAKDLEKAYLKNEDRFIEIKRMSIEEAIEKCSKDFCSDITTIAILSVLKNYNTEEQ